MAALATHSSLLLAVGLLDSSAAPARGCSGTHRRVPREPPDGPLGPVRRGVRHPCIPARHHRPRPRHGVQVPTMAQYAPASIRPQLGQARAGNPHRRRDRPGRHGHSGYRRVLRRPRPGTTRPRVEGPHGHGRRSRIHLRPRDILRVRVHGPIRHSRRRKRARDPQPTAKRNPKNAMKIVLVLPPYNYSQSVGNTNRKTQYGLLPPLGAGYLAAYIEQQGHAVVLVDAIAEQLDVSQTTETVAAHEPDAVGISSFTTLTPNTAYALAGALRARLPDVPL
ncbi:MAG TPA: cobalamin B12-binding domain-containing protein, partial [Candidatus Hydrogenedentes bacterium]|nr:cobalamin B12-binding domain-containing protein [Candidatus Hydrogenedentota bacterium]